VSDYQQEIICSIALSNLPHIGLVTAKRLYEEAGSATAIFEYRKHITDLIPEATPLLKEALSQCDEALRLAEKEYEYTEKKHIKAYTMNSPEYPQRLLECNDAPLILFFCGNTDLNCRHVINLVGTRRCTQYGKDICRDFIADLQRECPDVLIVSGLAYGIDIHAHRAALHNSMATVGVLAHGLDRIYPALHRQTAAKMTENGGLLTEYLSGTTPEKVNFVRRNRIVAGISDATIVVESAEHGGALITAELASTYNRDVFAFPGRITDEFSEGCNKLIARQKATMILNADEFLKSMNWKQESSEAKTNDGQQELFPQLTPEEAAIVEVLRHCDSKQVNQIVVETGLNFHTVSSTLYELEYKGIVMLLGGARYKLVLH
jgi:DNA processing protein